MTVESIAKVCHEANRALRVATLELPVGAHFELVTEEERESTIAGVREVLADPTLDPETLHSLWVQTKSEQGWTSGPVRDVELKTHPNLKIWEELDPRQKAKDVLFLGIVRALAPLVAE